LGRRRQEDHKFKASLGYIVRSCRKEGKKVGRWKEGRKRGREGGRKGGKMLNHKIHKLMRKKLCPEDAHLFLPLFLFKNTFLM
jgi:hypothetical protein